MKYDWNEQDALAVARDLGRVPRGVVGAAARCVCGNPLVVATVPRLEDGTPFPTTFYLTDRALTVAISRLEAERYMDVLTEMLAEDDALRAGHRQAHEDYLQRRQAIGQAAGTGDVPEIAGITAGGLPDRVKCLHALAGHSLAAGPGVNPVGDLALEEVERRGWWKQAACNCESPQPAPKGVGITRVAAVDCGTNSIRLLIADVPTSDEAAAGAGRWAVQDLRREMVITRLGQGVDKTGVLASEALERTFATARDYRKLIDRFQVDAVRVVATSATRDAENRDQFVSGMRDIMGVAPEVIAGEEEAELSFMGALSCLPDHVEPPFLIVDIGGGSTEFVLGRTDAEQAVSVNIGSVRVSERFRMEPWNAQNQAEAVAWINQELDSAAERIDFSRVATLVGVAGTVTTLAAYTQGLEEYTPSVTHGCTPSQEQWDEAVAFMVEAPVEDKAALGFMPPGRADVIGGGALVWQQVLHRVREASAVPQEDFTVVVSEHDILDGIALGLSLGLAKNSAGNAAERSAGN